MKNIKEINLEKIKKSEIDILKYIEKICKENNIKYSLMDGSLLGAVRHNGFIPWDDDIDIMLLREDYDKLKRVILNDSNNSRYLYMSNDLYDDYLYPYAKLIDTETSAKETGIKAPKNYGIFVDIFPIDKIPIDSREKNRFLKKVKILYKLYKFRIFDKQISNNKIKLIIKKLIAIPLKLVSVKKIVNKLEKISIKYNDENIDNYAIVCQYNTVNKKITYPKNFFENVHYTKFENIQALIIDKYDEYLKNIFENYMMLPSIENRKSNHNWDYIKFNNER